MLVTVVLAAGNDSQESLDQVGKSFDLNKMDEVKGSDREIQVASTSIVVGCTGNGNLHYKRLLYDVDPKP
jgi:hypothetical protein